MSILMKTEWCYPADSTIVHVSGTVGSKEVALKDARGELDAVLEGRVEGVDDGRGVVPLPVRLVDLLADLAPHVLRTPLSNFDSILEMLQRRNLKVLK